MYQTSQISQSEITCFNNLVLNPVILNDDTGTSHLTGVNETTTIENSGNCDYFAESKFNNMMHLEHQQQKPFCLMHLNITSPNNKFNDFTEYLESLNCEFSIMGISECCIKI